MSGIFDQIINYSPPLIVSGTVNYKGTWNASTNNPTLNSSPASSTKGDYYVVSTAGTQFGITFAIGDWIISNGTAWEKVDLTDAVSSVFGRTGAVVGVSTDYSAVGLTNTAIGASNPSTGAFTTVSATTPIAGTSGGTGVNNGANTITIAGNVTHAGAFTQSFTATANTSLTLPTTGTLATLAGSEALSNKTITASPISGSTGAFTTLSASGTTTVGPNNTGTGLALLQLLGGSGTNGGASVYFGTNGTAYSSIGQSSGIIGGTSTDFVIYANNSGQSIKFYAGNAGLVGTISNTGLAVTGSITSTSAFISNGSVTTNGASRVTLDYDSGAAKSRVLGWGATTGTAGTLTLGVLSSNASVLATDVATISSTGLAVTGALTATGKISPNRSNTLNTQVLSIYGSDYGLGMDSSDLVAFFNSGGGFSIKGGGDYNGTTYGRFTTTGLAVTGEVAPSTLRFNRSNGAAWDSNGIRFQIDGTTYSKIGMNDSSNLRISSGLVVDGALSKGSGSFRIEHPLPEKSATHQLVHSFIEGPQADLIYRGKVVLIDGKASVNIDAAATMTEGTFEVLCRDVQCFTTNESGWTAVRGKVAGNILTIEAKDADCTDEISWMVIGERQDPHMMETDWTDDNGKVIVEPLKPSIEPIQNT